MTGNRGDETFSALSNATRRSLLGMLLSEGEQPVQQLASHFDMRRPSVSEHLRVLREVGLVKERRSGRHRYYRLEPGPLIEIKEWLTPFEEFWREKMASLHELLEEEAK